MRFAPEIAEAVVAHSLFEFPNEACGLFAIDNRGEVRMCYSLSNMDKSPRSYTVNPTEHFRALQHAERNGWRLGGVFHSHTSSPAVPSSIDRRKALEPDWLYVIVGLSDLDAPEIRAFRITDGKVTEEFLGIDELNT